MKRPNYCSPCPPFDWSARLSPFARWKSGELRGLAEPPAAAGGRQRRVDALGASASPRSWPDSQRAEGKALRSAGSSARLSHREGGGGRGWATLRRMWQWSALVAMGCFAAMQLVFRQLSRRGIETSAILLLVFAFAALLYLLHVAVMRTPLPTKLPVIALLAGA